MRHSRGRAVFTVWSEAEFRQRLGARAKELGVPLRQLLAEAGMSHDTIDKTPVSGRRIDTLERCAAACHWSLAEMMGHDVLSRISIELLVTAFQAAQRVLYRLPKHAETEHRLVELQAHIYDALAAREREGRRVDAEIVRAFEDMLVATWADEAPRTVAKKGP